MLSVTQSASVRSPLLRGSQSPGQQLGELGCAAGAWDEAQAYAGLGRCALAGRPVGWAVFPYVCTVKTASGATAVQIVHSSRRGSRDIDYIGSAHNDVQLEVLRSAVRQWLAVGQGELDLGLSPPSPPGRGTGGCPSPITAARMGHLHDALAHAYEVLGFGQAAGRGRGVRSEARRRLESPGNRGDRLGDGQQPLVGPARAHHLEAERNPVAVGPGRDDHHRATAGLRQLEGEKGLHLRAVVGGLVVRAPGAHRHGRGNEHITAREEPVPAGDEPVPAVQDGQVSLRRTGVKHGEEVLDELPVSGQRGIRQPVLDDRAQPVQLGGQPVGPGADLRSAATSGG